MFLGLDIGRQYVKMVAAEKYKDGYKLVDAGLGSIPELTLPLILKELTTHTGLWL